MKIKNFLPTLALVTIMLLYGCSDDENSINEENSVKKYISTYTYTPNGNPEYALQRKFFYNEDKTIKEITWDYYVDEFDYEVFTYKFSYDMNNRINKIEQYVNDELLINETSLITYDENGILSQIGSNSVSYDSSTNTYTVQTNSSPRVYKFNEEQDIEIWDNLTFEYNTQKKGPGYDSQNQFVSLLMRSIIGSELILPLSRRPFLKYANESLERTATNVFDDAGYLIKSTHTPFNDIHEFTYINL